ncbi:MAG: 2-isopropylmalate synthase [Rhodococcus sp.]|uniref:alpha-isopropylmalate synthase regulatory domain-containing protein n=1 Tax=Rhodococcus TaxID=1827 RepID=UPI001691EC04|nr:MULTISPECIES: alpha-isopropylmalate synthase regulatory domain-containing protein [Rhodococcus]NLV79251.1 2-isopropylmalate synthase [Rhodococcus sp. (in: high G+C Gram-positive bacteria)]
MNAFISTTSFISATVDSCRGDSHRARPGDPFEERFGSPLPRDLRTEAAGSSWSEFSATYAPQGGPLRLGGWSRRALPGGYSTFEATIAVGRSITTATATAGGPVGAMTGMLHDLGYRLEILSFHRRDLGDRYATFIRCEAGDHRIWAMGMAEDATESALRAMIAGVNRLHAMD